MKYKKNEIIIHYIIEVLNETNHVFSVKEHNTYIIENLI